MGPRPNCNPTFTIWVTAMNMESEQALTLTWQKNGTRKQGKTVILNKAYILGMLFADGHNDTEKNVVTLSLQEEDKEILDKISIELGSNKPLYYVHNEELSKKHGLKMKNQYRLRVSSYIMS